MDKRKKTILLTNDDGFDAPGIIAIKAELEKVAKVVTIAPSGPRSGTGKTHNRRAPLFLKKTGKDSYSFDGNPADCVQVALHSICKKPDMIVSGINRGENLGIGSFFLSGTQGATIEGALFKIPGVAFSQYFENWVSAREKTADSYRPGAKLASELVSILLESFPKEVDYFNVNFPESCSDETEFVNTKFAELDWKMVLEKKGGKFSHRRGALGKPIPAKGTDVEAILKGKVSITPVKLKVENPEIEWFKE